MSRLLLLVVALTVAAGLGATAATILLGLRGREDTVVERPYEEGLRLVERGDGGARSSGPGLGKERADLLARACDLAAGPCTSPLEGGGEVSLEIAPRPIRTMAELEMKAEVRGPATIEGRDEVTVAFSMAGMDMGKNEVRLAPAGAAFTGKAILVRCPGGGKEWIVEVRVAPAAGPIRATRFRLTAEQ